MISDKIVPWKKLSETFIVYVSLTILFLISITYYYWIGNAIFSYQENRSLFFWSKEYLLKFTFIPGGLLEYTGKFLTQSYYSSLYGSLIISIFLILLCIVFLKINKRLSAERSFSLLFMLIPSCLSLLMQKNYEHFIYFSLGFLLTALYFLFSISPGKSQIRLVFLALFPAFFYLVGSFALIFVGMYILYSTIYEKGIFRYFLPVLAIVIFILTFIFFKEILFLQPADRLMNYPIPVFNLSLLSADSYLLIAYFILFPFFIKTFGFFKSEKRINLTFQIPTILIVFPVTVLLLLSHNDLDRSNLIHLEESVYKQDWDAIIKQHESSPSRNVTGQYFYNLALAEKDQLCNRLFFGRQDFGSESLSLQHDNEYLNKSFYFYYTIGMISESHHLAYESMVINGYSPENIKMLIKTELISRNYEIAVKNINILKKTLHYRSWAEKYEKMLFDTALINSDPELSEKTRLLPKRDFFVRPDDVQNIELVLMASPDNKRAFEYKIARLLLEKDLREVVSEIPKMKEMGYTYIPRHLEEAVVEFINLNKESPDLGGLTISHETELRFVEYLTAYDLCKRGDKLWSEKEMKKTWKDTFWYYLQFN